MDKTNTKLKEEKLCPTCERGKLKPADSIISEIGGYVFVEKGEICSSCGEEYISEEDAQRTITAARKLGVWPEPLKMYRKLSRSGRSLTLRIPADIERQLDLKPDEEVTITKIGNKIIIEQV